MKNQNQMIEHISDFVSREAGDSFRKPVTLEDILAINVIRTDPQLSMSLIDGWNHSVDSLLYQKHSIIKLIYNKLI